MGINTQNHEIIKEVNQKLSEKENFRTPEVRKISKDIYRKIGDKSIDNILFLSEELLKQKKWESGIIGFNWSYRVKNHYKENLFPTFERWLKDYVNGWGNCDDFCTHSFGELIRQNKHLYKRTLDWTNHPDFWVRRGAAVVQILAIRKGDYEGLEPFTIADKLMNDEHHLVLKGYGWLLKILSQKEPERVFEYVHKNKKQMPRLALRYAIEKFDDEKRQELLKL